MAAAAAGGHVDIAELCLPQDGQTIESLSSSLKRSKSKGWGPLHWAASNGHLAMTQFLVVQGFSLRDKAFDGSTAADLARKHGHDEIEVFLQKQEELERQHPKPADNAQPQSIKHNLRITGMPLSAMYPLYKS